MGFGASFGKNKQDNSGSYTGTDNYSGTTNFTQAPTNPQWVTDASQGIVGNATALAGANPTSYVAGPVPLLHTAANSAAGLTGTPWNYDGALDVTRGVANSKAPSIAGMIGQFENPEINSVVNSTLADFDHQAGLTRAQDDLNLAGSGAFGGSGAALTKSATEDALARARATTESTLRSNAFNTALGGATSQAGVNQNQQALRLQAGSELANIADQYGANQRANIAAQDSAGAPLQAINQAQAQAPLDLQSWLASVFGQSLPQLFQGQTGTENQSGTESQSGTQKGKVTGTSFGFGFGNK